MTTCARPGCNRSVPADRLACPQDWWALPQGLRDRIWEHYRPGQTIETATAPYMAALADVMTFWDANPSPRRSDPPGIDRRDVAAL